MTTAFQVKLEAKEAANRPKMKTTTKEKKNKKKKKKKHTQKQHRKQECSETRIANSPLISCFIEMNLV